MGMYHKVRVGDITINSIDWEMNPDISFGTFESWGGRERVRNNNERVYYFFIDNWGAEPKLCLMERAVKHARIIAEIKAPNDLIRKCVEDQGRSSTYEKSYAINEQVKEWLIAHVLDETGDSRLIMPTVDVETKEDMGPLLPRTAQTSYTGEVIRLPDAPAFIQEEELPGLLAQWNFFEAELHPEGWFANSLVDPGIAGVIIDQRTQLMWQSGGLDIGSIRHVQKGIEDANRNRMAGYADWRLPSMEEALSLLEPGQNGKGLFLHPAFSKEQPFIFVAAQRKPGGYWFVDFKQGRAFWSSGTIPGGFGRLVRSV